MNLKITIDTEKVLQAMIKAPRAFTKEIRVEMKEQMNAVARRAKLFHRFITRSGNLERSVQPNVSRTGFTGTVELKAIIKLN